MTFSYKNNGYYIKIFISKNILVSKVSYDFLSIRDIKEALYYLNHIDEAICKKFSIFCNFDRNIIPEAGLVP